MIFCPDCGGYCEINYQNNSYICKKCNRKVFAPTVEVINRRTSLKKL